jgi:hypothetical protein
MKPDATRWCQVIEGDPEIPEQQHKHAVKVTAVLVQQEPGNQNKEGPLDRYLTKDAVDLIQREPEGTHPAFSSHLPKERK